MAINKLNKTFVSGLVLHTIEMNQITDKVDEIITTSNLLQTKQQEDGDKIDSMDKEIGNIGLTKLSCVSLQVGNSQEIKEANLNAIGDITGLFFARLGYGYGVGTFNASKGGFVSIVNAYDNDTYYKISPDGEIVKDEDYVSPNEPYSVHLEASQIGTPLDEVTGSKVAKAGELIISGTTGLITYTRTADSTKSAIYFTDDNKDGSINLLTYNVSNKTINSTRIDASPKIQKQLISGATPNMELKPNIFYVFDEVTQLTLSLSVEIPNAYSEFMFQFTSGITPTVLNLPSGVKWIGNNTVEANKTYLVSILSNIAVMGGA